MLSRDTVDAALAPVRAALRWGAAVTVAACGLALLVAGPSAAAAAAAGGVIGLLAGRSMASGLAAAFAAADEAATDPTGAARKARRRAVAGAVLRYPLLGTALAGCVMLLGLPAGWLAAGITAWPASLLAAALRLQEAGALHSRG